MNWNFLHPIKKDWQNYQTHGSIQEKLIQSGELPSPFFGTNEDKFNWIEDHTWELISDTIFGEANSSKMIDIHFPSIDTYASIYWNDSLVLVAENAFRPYSIQVLLKSNSTNKIRAVFTPPVLYHKARYESEIFHYPAPNDPNKIAISNLTRKPQYQFGWDWTARMNTLGFMEPVSWEFQKSNSLERFAIDTKSLNFEKAEVTYKFLFNSIDQDLKISSSLFGTIDLRSNDTVVGWKNSIDNPKLWWPNGFGESYLYHDTIRIYLKSGELTESKVIQFGIRKSELVQEKDRWGTSFVLKINDKPVFCKGANLIPPSVFPSQITDSVWEEHIQVMKEQHFNMVRVWGGGLYPSEYFFKRCDEEGIMVWQDFMFACAMYPADSLFLESVKAEMNYQIPRISSHSSVVLLNGNNEVDVAWKNWGLQKQYNLSPTDSIKIAADYRNLFQEKIPRWVANYTDIPYVHTSPLSNWGAPERYNHGSQHYWGVWHGNDSIDGFSKNIGRFNAEFGFQSFPEYSTLLEIGKPHSWNLDSLGIQKHQKSYIGNGKINKNIERYFTKPRDFMEFVYYSQLIQADALEKAVSAHRLNAPRCMGTLYWQLNDCYPGPTWSSLDYLGNRKILYYRMKEVMNPVNFFFERNKEGFELKIASDLPQRIVVNYKIEGLVKRKNKFHSIALTSDSIQMEYLQNSLILNRDQLNRYFISNSLDGIQISWSVNNRSFTKIIWLKDVLMQLTKRNKVKIRIKKIDKKNKSLILSVKTNDRIDHFWIYSTTKGVRFAENDLQLLPGKREVKVEYQTKPRKTNFRWLGLENTLVRF
ncbi:MAG: glycosyl hydrolase 2 galactose-binding domain-containing protein [Bacteroidota bacterium]